MPFLLLLCLSLACLPVPWREPPFAQSPKESLFGALAAAGALLAYVAVVTWRTRRRLRTWPEQRDRWLADYGRARTKFALLAMGLFVLALFGYGWGWAVQGVVRGWVGERPLPPGTELLILAPLPLCLTLSWAVFYDAERAVHGLRPFGGRWGYVGVQVRQNLALICAPVVVLALLNGLFRQFAATRSETVQTIILVPLGLIAVVMLPRLVRMMLKLDPLPPGRLADRLEAAGKRLNCRYSHIQVWNTKNGMANAMVVGVAPWLRYVLLSDRLIDEFTPDEVEAVFGHEAGHVKHRHMAFYLAFLTASLVMMSRAGTLLEAWVKAQWPQAGAGAEAWMALPMTLGLAAYVFGVFGYLSRRCERQADVYACRAVSCGDPECIGHDEKTGRVAGGAGLCPSGIRTFCGALDKVAELNGLSRDRPGWLHSWQHSTIARRVAFLEDMAADPSIEPRFQKHLFWAKAALLLATAAAGGLLWLV